jgi:hypothetical protein
MGVIRHPWYAAVFILLWAGDLKPSEIVINVILSGYLIIGTLLEERKLVLEFGDRYRQYQDKVSMFIPVKWLKAKLHRGGVTFPSQGASYLEEERNFGGSHSYDGKEGGKMKKVACLGWLIVFLPALVFAQEKIEAPVWNTGDKWVFDREGPMEVTGSDGWWHQWLSVKFSGGIFPKGASGIAIFERPTFNVKYMLEGDRRKEYWGLRKKVLNFPFSPGKQWKDLYQTDEMDKGLMKTVEHQQTFRVLGWEEVQVRAGKFKAIKLEYKIETSTRIAEGWAPLGESKAWYWYSPEVKNFVKSQYAKGYCEAILEEKGSRENWELVSYRLNK